MGVGVGAAPRRRPSGEDVLIVQSVSSYSTTVHSAEAPEQPFNLHRCGPWPAGFKENRSFADNLQVNRDFFALFLFLCILPRTVAARCVVRGACVTANLPDSCSVGGGDTVDTAADLLIFRRHRSIVWRPVKKAKERPRHQRQRECRRPRHHHRRRRRRLWQAGHTEKRGGAGLSRRHFPRARLCL